jgi:hypothetical protein
MTLGGARLAATSPIMLTLFFTALIRGLLAIEADKIRETGSEVRDSRDVYFGHADLDHGFPALPPHDPAATPEQLKQMDDRIDALLAHARAHPDPTPHTSGWGGPELSVRRAPGAD